MNLIVGSYTFTEIFGVRTLAETKLLRVNGNTHRKGIRMSFIQLEGTRVSLIPLELDHAASLFECSRNPQVWEFLPIKIHAINEMISFIHQAISARIVERNFLTLYMIKN
ncbi:hypothetical protein D3C73_857670 [compost metagenome]